VDPHVSVLIQKPRRTERKKPDLRIYDDRLCRLFLAPKDTKELLVTQSGAGSRIEEEID